MGLGNGGEKTNAREQFLLGLARVAAAPANPLQAKQISNVSNSGWVSHVKALIK